MHRRPRLLLPDRADEAATYLADFDMAIWVHDHRDQSDTAYAKFIPDPGVTGRVFASTLLTGGAHTLHLNTWP